MNKIFSGLMFAGLAALVPSIVSVAVAQTPAPAAPAIEMDMDGLPLGPGHDLTVEKCTGCHGASNFAGQRNDANTWGGIIASMNADVTAAQAAEIQTYLATYLGPTPPPAAAAAPAAAAPAAAASSVSAP